MKITISPFKIALSLILATLLYSCAREDAYMGDDINITTSRDTIMFDTVFTEAIHEVSNCTMIKTKL